MKVRECTDSKEIKILFKHMLNSDTISTVRYRNWGSEGDRHVDLFKNKQRLHVTITSPTSGHFEFHTKSNSIMFKGEIPSKIVGEIMERYIISSEERSMSDFIEGLQEGNREHPIKKPIGPPNVTFTDTPVRGSGYD